MTDIQSRLRVLLVGCGKMGTAMAQGWLKSDLLEHLIILDPMDIDPSLKNDLVFHVNSAEDLKIEELDAVILAVKPQLMESVCASIKDKINKDVLVLSIAAGTPMKFFENQFHQDQPVIRTMPNTPAAIGKGITAAIPNKAVSEKQKEYAQSLLFASGTLVWLDQEELFHAVTALSGSGPAYIFYLIETMTKAGIEIGLDEQLATQLARQTVIGSAALAEHQHDVEASKLRENVTSPGGTTQAALEILMDGHMEDIFKKALGNAQKRSIELSGF